MSISGLFRDIKSAFNDLLHLIYNTLKRFDIALLSVLYATLNGRNVIKYDLSNVCSIEIWNSHSTKECIQLCKKKLVNIFYDLVKRSIIHNIGFLNFRDLAKLTTLL